MSINRTSVYYLGTPVSNQELECKAIIDHLHTDNPTWGARQMSSQLKMRGYQIGRKKARRYMNEMAIDPIYPKPNLSKRLKQAQVVPYLLRNAVITAPNQAWSIDITYIPMKRGFLYLTAIIDWYSRCIVGWELDDTLDTRACIEACKKAFKVAKPIILNSDQGCQFTSSEYKEFLKENGIRQSMDGKSRWADNIMIERWFAVVSDHCAVHFFVSLSLYVLLSYLQICYLVCISYIYEYRTYILALIFCYVNSS
jgi:putative transposase